MHNLFGERFFSERRGWHNVGPQIDRPMPASEAWSTLSPYVITLEDVELVAPYDLVLPYRTIVRHPVPDDPEYRSLGIVGPEYVLIDPQRFCEIFDEAVGEPVGTLGALGRGETLFLSVPLPRFDVLGDEVENYMLVVSPYAGNAAYELITTSVRVVCQNTLRAARRQSTESYRIVHDGKSEGRLRTWMSGMFQRASSRAETLREFYEIIGGYRPTGSDVLSILETVYPSPKDPRISPNAPESEIELRLPVYEQDLARVQRMRDAVQELFDGKGTGLDEPRVRGTGWALYNAFTEWESWRRTTDVRSRDQSLILGSRVRTIQSAYSAILDFSMR